MVLAHKLIRMGAIVAIISATHTEMASAQLSPAIPGCACTAGVEVPYAASGTNGPVHAATCQCGNQFCAISWNKSIDMQCVKQDFSDTQPKDNCITFTTMNTGEYASPLQVGNFVVTNIKPGSSKKIYVDFDDINTPPPIMRTPNMLRLRNDTEINFHVKYKSVTVDWTWYTGGQMYIIAHTGLNTVVNNIFSAPSVNQGETTRVTITNSNGIKAIQFPTNEIGVFEVCGIQPIP